MRNTTSTSVSTYPKDLTYLAITRKYLTFIEHRLNSRFMSVISYKTPQELLDEYRQEVAPKQKNEQKKKPR